MSPNTMPSAASPVTARAARLLFGTAGSVTSPGEIEVISGHGGTRLSELLASAFPSPPGQQNQRWMAVHDTVMTKPRKLAPAVSVLRPAVTEFALSAEHVAIEVGDPLPAAGRHVQITNGALDVRRYAVPIKLRIEVSEIGGRRVAQLLVHSDFFKLVIERIGFAQVMRIAELADEVGGANQEALFIVVVRDVRRRKAGEFDG